MFAIDITGESPVSGNFERTTGLEKTFYVDNSSSECRRKVFADYRQELFSNQRNQYLGSVPTSITVVLSAAVTPSIRTMSDHPQNKNLNRCKSLFAMVDQMPNHASYSSIRATSRLHKSGTEINIIDHRSVATDVSFTSTDSSLPEKSSPTQSTIDDKDFAQQMHRYLGDMIHEPNFEDYAGIRKIMEPFLRKARLARQDAMTEALSGVIDPVSARRLGHGSAQYSDLIGKSVGVPYSALRQERPFLFDEHTHPLHTLLAQALDVPDLSRLHVAYSAKDVNQHQLLSPLLDEHRRYAFHAAFDCFVTSHCVPLLHSLAISNNIFNHNINGVATNSGRITYRYQGFPTVQVVRPGESGSNLGPTCDVMDNHSIGCLMFYIPLTSSEGTSCMYVESYPGRENWHPLKAKSVGLGYLFDGARCLRFGLKNTTNQTRVSLIFRVVIYRDQSREIPTLEKILQVSESRALSSEQLDQQMDELFGTPATAVIDDSSDLCPLMLLEDNHSLAGPGYYDEVVIDVQSRQERIQQQPPATSSLASFQHALASFQNAGLLNVSVKKNGSTLNEPDYRSGHPFTFLT